jgi:hypothetical protein
MSKNSSNKIRTITARVTQDERDALTRRAAGRSLSDYIRRHILGKKSRAPLQSAEKQALARLSRMGVVISDFTQHVATHGTLKRGEVIKFLGGMEDDLHAVRLAILKGGADDGDC